MVTGPKSRFWRGDALAIERARETSPSALAKNFMLMNASSDVEVNGYREMSNGVGDLDPEGLSRFLVRLDEERLSTKSRIYLYIFMLLGRATQHGRPGLGNQGQTRKDGHSLVGPGTPSGQWLTLKQIARAPPICCPMRPRGLSEPVRQACSEPLVPVAPSAIDPLTHLG